MTPNGTNQPQNKDNTWSLLGFAWELGYSLAIPIVVLIIAGRLLDKKFGTSPWLLLTGVILSLFTSTLTVYSKATKIIAETEESQKSKWKMTKQNGKIN